KRAGAGRLARFIEKRQNIEARCRCGQIVRNDLANCNADIVAVADKKRIAGVRRGKCRPRLIDRINCTQKPSCLDLHSKLDRFGITQLPTRDRKCLSVAYVFISLERYSISKPFADPYSGRRGLGSRKFLCKANRGERG